MPAHKMKGGYMGSESGVIATEVVFKEDTTNSVKKTQSAYRNHIKKLIYCLNQCGVSEDNKRSQIIDHLHEITQHFLSTQNLSIHGQILFSRHGESTMWGQKGFGLIPNAPISTAATGNLAKTKENTLSLLSFKNKITRIFISPLTRAMQTAGLIIPKEIYTSAISFDPGLSENSKSPSGFDIRRPEDFATIRNTVSFWREPIQFILFYISQFIFGSAYYQSQKTLRTTAFQNIQKHHSGESPIQGDEAVKQDLSMEEEGRIARITQIIEESHNDNLWLIGHGNNFKRFFKKFFGMQLSFEFAETQGVYKVTDDKDSSFFVPPYSLVINQRTGVIEGKYTGQMVTTQATVKEEIIASSYVFMHQNELGLAPVNASVALRQTTEEKRPAPLLDRQLDTSYEINVNHADIGSCSI